MEFTGLGYALRTDPWDDHLNDASHRTLHRHREATEGSPETGHGEGHPNDAYTGHKHEEATEVSSIPLDGKELLNDGTRGRKHEDATDGWSKSGHMPSPQNCETGEQGRHLNMDKECCYCPQDPVDHENCSDEN